LMRDQWSDAVVRLGGRPTDAADDLMRRYAEPHRKYHTAEHVLAVLAAARLLSDRDSPVLTLAICAHDVVYAGEPGSDERASAAWAREALTAAGLAADDIAHVESLVLATITHESDDPLAQIMLDADLAILAAEQAAYDRYASRVREEYARYTDEVWRQGRAKVLKTLLARPNLYATEKARALWESKARANMARELQALGVD
jgi:predicted metal-dependent HD superfamily phosphohydrolase